MMKTALRNEKPAMLTHGGQIVPARPVMSVCV